jgi:hypothetical protein
VAQARFASLIAVGARLATGGQAGRTIQGIGGVARRTVAQHIPRFVVCPANHLIGGIVAPRNCCTIHRTAQAIARVIVAVGIAGGTRFQPHSSAAGGHRSRR